MSESENESTCINTGCNNNREDMKDSNQRIINHPRMFTGVKDGINST